MADTSSEDRNLKSRSALIKGLTFLFLLGSFCILYVFSSSLSIPEYKKIIAQPSKKPLLVPTNEIKPGETKEIFWNNRPIGIYKRTQQEISQIGFINPFVADPFSKLKTTPLYSLKEDPKEYFDLNSDWVQTSYRSIRKDVFVADLISPISGCYLKLLSNTDQSRQLFPQHLPKGFYDSCSRARFDLSGRIYINERLMTHHMTLPHYRFISSEEIELYY